MQLRRPVTVLPLCADLSRFPGDYKQNGGEYLFEDGELKWCHRMRTTSDHAEVKELKQVLGL